jgi:hypothetical protein
MRIELKFSLNEETFMPGYTIVIDGISLCNKINLEMINSTYSKSGLDVELELEAILLNKIRIDKFNPNPERSQEIVDAIIQMLYSKNDSTTLSDPIGVKVHPPSLNRLQRNILEAQNVHSK